MKKIVYSIMAIASLSMVSCGGAANEATAAKTDSIVAPSIDGTYALAEGSSIIWKAKHNNDTAYVHTGKVMVTGSVVVLDSAVNSGSFAFDMKSIDKDGEGEFDVKLEGHLKSLEFFAVDSIPTATFNITGISGNVITGDLTVLGISKSIVIPATIAYSGDIMTVSASVVVNFLDYSLPYLVKGTTLPEAEKATFATSEVAIEFALTLNKQAATTEVAAK